MTKAVKYLAHPLMEKQFGPHIGFEGRGERGLPWKAERQGPVMTRISPDWRRIGVGTCSRVGPPSR
jgi:hypothetical protein